ncbi:hypothetical protein [Marinococcus luteus]|uniref:hypothetical protein n=1 Tax=Marinococcus luteus TaxID=1122204 RepID=UPI002ACC7FE2|nr:hypothetical protein [Marinococcus luteus]MDZ5782105.1 hypothetical protein [Marinococcus luteus]
MNTIEVTNTGKRSRARLGINFEPNKTRTVEATKRQTVVLRAVKDFDIKIIPEEPAGESTNGGDGKDKGGDETLTDAQLEEIQAMTIENFKKAIAEYGISNEDAIAIEENGQKRKSLLEELEAPKE